MYTLAVAVKIVRNGWNDIFITIPQIADKLMVKRFKKIIEGQLTGQTSSLKTFQRNQLINKYNQIGISKNQRFQISIYLGGPRSLIENEIIFYRLCSLEKNAQFLIKIWTMQLIKLECQHYLIMWHKIWSLPEFNHPWSESAIFVNFAYSVEIEYFFKLN